jgi:hypothetical protein
LLCHAHVLKIHGHGKGANLGVTYPSIGNTADKFPDGILAKFIAIALGFYDFFRQQHTNIIAVKQAFWGNPGLLTPGVKLFAERFCQTKPARRITGL